MSKFRLYRILAPFRSRQQSRLREERLSVDLDIFTGKIEEGPNRAEVARHLWEILREEAFVEDFRPDAEDSLSKIYAMGPEEIWEDLIDPIANRLHMRWDDFDVNGFDFATLDTPKRVAEFLMRM